MLIGRIPCPARPSGLSVRFLLALNLKTKMHTETKIVVNRNNRCANSSKDKRSSGRPHNASALGQYVLLVTIIITKMTSSFFFNFKRQFGDAVS